MGSRPNFARRRVLAAALAVAVVSAVLLLTHGEGGDGRAATTTTGAAPRADAAVTAAARLSDAAALGQAIVGRYGGTTPSSTFLARVRRGEVGSVILFGDNTADGVTRTRRAVDALQAAARAGGHPALLVMIDQEGGDVVRLKGAPDRAAAAMTSASVARAQGVATGRLLRSAGVNVDLAPVADVRRLRRSFLGTRAFGTSPGVVAERACAFAAGLRSTKVAAFLKHFPGLGRAAGNTDDGRIAIDATAGAIRSDYAPYAACGGVSLTGVMMSSATYPRLLGPDAPAVMSRTAYVSELRGRARVPATAPTISDDLDAAAIRGRDHPARRALLAGLDLLLYAGSERTSAAAYGLLLKDVRAGTIPEARVRDAAADVLRLKAALAAESPSPRDAELLIGALRLTQRCAQPPSAKPCWRQAS